MAEIKPKRRWFKFSLRMLWALVTLTVVGSSGYWVVWPWWQTHLEDLDLEKNLRDIHAGGHAFDATQIGHPFEHHMGERRCHDGTTLFWVAIIRPNAIYQAALKLETMHGGPTGANPPREIDFWPIIAVEVFRLPPAPVDYQPRTQGGREALAKWQPHWDVKKELLGYLFDYEEFFAGDRKDNHDLKYELIYSDPPSKPAN